jgi:hypothetical protein
MDLLDTILLLEWIIFQTDIANNENLIDKKLQAMAELEGLLLDNHSFSFKAHYNKKRFISSGIIFMLVSIIVSAGTGTLLFYIQKWTGIANDYVILGIGAGAGALFGGLLGWLLLIGLQTRIIEEYGAGYGIGISTNIFIGAIIGILFGAGVGALYGLILEALNYSIDTTFVYPVYGMLIWIVLGLNIGVLVGLVSSFGFIEIILGGAITGLIIGTIGSLVYFGPDIIVLIGSAAGLVSGTLIGFLVKSSIRASLGKASDISCFCGQKLFELDQRIDTRRRRRVYYCGPNYLSYDNINCMNCSPRGSFSGSGSSCYGSNCGSTCCGSNCGSTCCGSNCGTCDCIGMSCGAGNCFGIGFIVLILLIPITIIVSIISWFSAQASIRFGTKVQKGAVTALTSSTSIGVIIGCSIAITMTFHPSLSVFAITGIGAGFGLGFALILYLAYIISLNVSELKIVNEIVTWKDRYTSGAILLQNIDDYSFIEQGELVEGIAGRTEDYVLFNLVDGSSQKILLSCWDVPEGIESFEYIQTILEYKIDRVMEELIVNEEE